MITFHAATESSVAFSIGDNLYFMRILPAWRIYNSDLRPLVIPNLDSWFQAHTQQRFGLQNFLDMAAAFTAGLRLSYSSDDLARVCRDSALEASRIIVEKMPQYRKIFWIESLDPVKLESVWVERFRNDFNRLRRKLGDDLLFAQLCRMYHFAARHSPGLVAVFTRFIERLGRQVTEPVLPSNTRLDAELVETVLQKVVKRETPYKGIRPDIHQRLGQLHREQAPLSKNL